MKVYPKSNPDDELKMEEIAVALGTAQVASQGGIYLTFMYAGVDRQCRVIDREIAYMVPYGDRAMRVAVEILRHILRYPNDYLSKKILLRVVLGND